MKKNKSRTKYNLLKEYSKYLEVLRKIKNGTLDEKPKVKVRR